MAVKSCRDCGQAVVWVVYAVNAEGAFLRDEKGKAIVHKCEPRPASDRPQQADQEPTIPFGKYKGWKVAALAQDGEGIDYLKWLVDHVQKQWLKDAITDALKGHYGSNMRPVQEQADSSSDDSWDD